MRGSNTYLIQLRPEVNSDNAKNRLERIPGVRTLVPDDEPVDMSSIRSIDRKISHLTSEERDDHPRSNQSLRGKERDRADYLKAYRYFTAQRAFPDDKVNWDALEVGRQHAAKMPLAGLKGKNSFLPLTASSWTFLGPTNLIVPYEQYYGEGVINGRVNAVTFDPTNPLVMYAGGAQGGLWKTADGGTTWTWLSSTWTQLGVNAIVVDPTHSNTIYVARGDYHGEIAGSYGVMKSIDGGTTWSEIAQSTMGKVGVASIMLDPTNSQTIIAGTGDINTYGSLYRSTDGGATWKKLAVGGSDCMWPTIASSASASGKVRFYTVAAGYAQASTATTRVFKSDDHGATWQALASQVVPDGNFHFAYEVATSPTNPKNVYILDSENMALFTSINQGAGWTDVSANLPAGNDIGTNYNFSQSFYDYHLECGNRVSGTTNTDILYLGEIDITESADAGKTWTSIGGPSYESNAIAHNDQHCLAVCPTDPNFAIFSNDGGVYSLTYNPTTGTNSVSSLNKNLGNTMFYKMAFHPNNSSYILGGTQDNASPLSTGDLSNWLNVGGGDGGGSAINQNNPEIQYTTSEELVIYRTNNGWTTEQDISPQTTTADNLPFVATMTLDPNNQNLMYVGTNFLYQWNESTQTWTNQLGGQDLTNEANSSVVIQAISVAPGDTNRIYTGSSDGALWMSKDQGNTWTSLSSISKGLPNSAITSISISPTNENDILVGYSGAGKATGHIFRCANTLASAPAFTNLTGTLTTALPDVSLNAIARDILNPTSTWYVGMDAGVFQTTDSGATWSNAGVLAGLPNVIVDDLQTVSNGGYLYAGTYGRGIWRLPLLTSLGTLSTFTITPTSVSAGGTSVGTVTISAPAPAAGAVVALSSSDTSVATVPSSVAVSAGATTATFTISTNAALTGPGTAIISASDGGVTLTQTLSVSVSSLTVTSLTLSPTSVTGGATSTGTVTLNGASPAGGTVVTLSSNSVGASLPPTVTVLAGTTTATFSISTLPVSSTTTASITATLVASSVSTPLTIIPASITALSVSPTSVQGGNTATGTVTLSGKSGANGTVVSLTSNNVSAKVPTSITVNPGASSATFSISTSAVSSSIPVTLTGTAVGASQTAILTITPATLSRVAVAPSTVIGGATSIATVTLTGAAGPGGALITIGSNSSNASVPATITVPAGSSTTTFTITTTSVTSSTIATITGSLAGVNQSATLTISPSGLEGLTINPTSVQGGTSATGTVTLFAAATTGGTKITLSSSNASATVPGSVTVPAGATTASFTISTSAVTTLTTSTLTASLLGSPQTAILTITPGTGSTLQSVSFNPATVAGGATSIGTVTLSGNAPVGGTTVNLSANSSTISLPPSVLIQAGSSSATFIVNTKAVSTSTTVTVVAKSGTVSISGSLVIQPISLVGLTTSLSALVGGSQLTLSGQVQLGAAAGKGGDKVTLKSSNAAILSVPASVTVPSGSQVGSFSIIHKRVTTMQTVTITASYAGVTENTIVVLSPFQVTALMVSPSEIPGGTNASGTLTLNAVPGSGSGAVSVSLASSSKSAHVPGSVSVGIGASTGKFTCATTPVSTLTAASLMATLKGSFQQASVTILPATLLSVSVSPGSVQGSTTKGVTATVTLSGPAASAGAIVTLSSSNTAAATVPANVKVASGKSSVTFQVAHKKVATLTSVTITAAYGGSTVTTTLTITP